MNPELLPPLFQSTTNAVGQPIAYPANGTPEVTALLVEMAPGDETGWHQHPVPLLGYIMEGELTVIQATGHKRVIPAGGISLESVGLVHNGISTGTVPCKMIVFVVGLKGVPATTLADGPGALNLRPSDAL